MGNLTFHVYDAENNVVNVNLDAEELEEKLKKKSVDLIQHDVVPVWEPSNSNEDPSY
jgi:16S rRNA A1518/A1519 N6-dimethyltransferase RsmA/KsgA/DIM1 with predicted DNA glycosylase/AP lyase activity|tara:strand:- start:377 stop:547 length:171 start_codon:yes stop_codon:yes gene_type:complete